MNIIDLTGKKYNSLLVLRKSDKKYKWGLLWVCKCDCGNIVEVRGGHLTSTQKTCLECAKKANLTHGMTNSSEYGIWTNMINRCEDKNNPNYDDYGGRGIKISQRWRNSFQAFFDDIGKRPSKKHSLDRIDNDGNYTKENCRWATQKQQIMNRRNTIKLTHLGKTMTLRRWAIKYGVEYDTARQRYHRFGGNNIELIMNNVKRGRQIEYNGKKMNISDWSIDTGIDIKSIHNRIRMGWDLRSVFTIPVNKKFTQ